MKSKFKKPIYILITSLLFTLILAELITRDYFKKLSPLPSEISKDSFYSSIKEFVPGKKGVKKNIFYRINSLGFRGKEPVFVSTKDLRNIVILGDSTSFGPGVAEDKTYSMILEKELNNNSTQKKYQIINLSSPGFGTAIGLDNYRQIGTKFHPQAVILAFFPNDLTDNKIYIEEKKMLRDQSFRGKINRLLYLRSRLKIYQLIMQFVSGFIGSGATSDWTEFWVKGINTDKTLLEQEEKLILELKRSVKKEFAELIILYLPTIVELTQESFIHNWLKNFAEREKIIFVDMKSIFRESQNSISLYLPNDIGHSSTQGHHLIARTLKNILNNLTLLN